MFRVPCATWLLNHGCLFALGIWLFISANRKLASLEQLAVAVTCLSGCAEIVFFPIFLTKIPAISGQSPLVPIIVWAAAVLIIAIAANRSRRSTGTASSEAAGYLRTHYLKTLRLITYPLYLTHNVIGSATIRVLVHAGLNDTLAVGTALGMLVLVCWFILREDRARHEMSAKGYLFKPRTASNAESHIEPAKPVSRVAPSAHPGKGELHGAVTAVRGMARADVRSWVTNGPGRRVPSHFEPQTWSTSLEMLLLELLRIFHNTAFCSSTSRTKYLLRAGTVEISHARRHTRSLRHPPGP